MLDSFKMNSLTSLRKSDRRLGIGCVNLSERWKGQTAENAKRNPLYASVLSHLFFLAYQNDHQTVRVLVPKQQIANAPVWTQQV